MAYYRVAGRTVADSDAGFASLLAQAYGSRQRPLCLCRGGGLEMYVARLAGGHVLKRMPGTGSRHAMACPSYEPPAALSGLDEVLGSAILPASEDGVTTLRCAFSLSRQAARAGAGAAPAAGGGGVRASPGRLTLRGLLHYLWHEAGLPRWRPAMEGKRSWSVVRWHLLKAAGDKAVRGRPLPDYLFIPEPYASEQRAAIAARRALAFERAGRAGAGAGLLLLVGEAKEFAPARLGRKLLVKHMPDCPFLLRDEVAQRVARRFKRELELWAAYDDLRLVVCGTFSVGGSGLPTVEEVTLMLVTPRWLPLEDDLERELLRRLVADGRRFDKCLRFNAADDRVLPCAVLCDTAGPVALYVLRAGESAAALDGALRQLREDCAFGVWVWDGCAGGMPELPPARGSAEIPGDEPQEKLPGFDD